MQSCDPWLLKPGKIPVVENVHTMFVCDNSLIGSLVNLLQIKIKFRLKICNLG